MCAVLRTDQVCHMALSGCREEALFAHPPSPDNTESDIFINDAKLLLISLENVEVLVRDLENMN